MVNVVPGVISILIYRWCMQETKESPIVWYAARVHWLYSLK